MLLPFLFHYLKAGMFLSTISLSVLSITPNFDLFHILPSTLLNDCFCYCETDHATRFMGKNYKNLNTTTGCRFQTLFIVYISNSEHGLKIQMLKSALWSHTHREGGYFYKPHPSFWKGGGNLKVKKGRGLLKIPKTLIYQ